MTRSSKTIRVKLFGLLLIGIFIMSGFYVYFVNTTVAEIVDRKNNLRNLQEIALDNQRMEESYFEILGQLNLEYAHSLGFIAQGQNDIAIRQTSMARLDSR